MATKIVEMTPRHLRVFGGASSVFDVEGKKFENHVEIQAKINVKDVGVACDVVQIKSVPASEYYRQFVYDDFRLRTLLEAGVNLKFTDVQIVTPLQDMNNINAYLGRLVQNDNYINLVNSSNNGNVESSNNE